MTVKTNSIETNEKEIFFLQKAFNIIHNTSCQEAEYSNCEGCPFFTKSQNDCILLISENNLRKIIRKAGFKINYQTKAN